MKLPIQKYLILLIALLLIACEDFQEENFALSALDLKAVEILTAADTARINIPVSNISSAWTGQAVYSNVSNIYNSLYDKGIVITFNDSCYHLMQPSLMDTIYLALENTVAREMMICYNAQYNLQILSFDGDFVDIDSERSYIEIASAYQVANSVNAILIERGEASIAAQNYLIRLMRNDLSSGVTFDICVLDKNEE